MTRACSRHKPTTVVHLLADYDISMEVLEAALPNPAVLALDNPTASLELSIVGSFRVSV
jgi:hypothetical protein